jgi:hypothetical protein
MFSHNEVEELHTPSLRDTPLDRGDILKLGSYGVEELKS